MRQLLELESNLLGALVFLEGAFLLGSGGLVDLFLVLGLLFLIFLDLQPILHLVVYGPGIVGSLSPDSGRHFFHGPKGLEEGQKVSLEEVAKAVLVLDRSKGQHAVNSGEPMLVVVIANHHLAHHFLFLGFFLGRNPLRTHFSWFFLWPFLCLLCLNSPFRGFMTN
jgi:hypothetical protein